ncbi:MAG: GWxTD domain-containing protein [Deferribacteres bacterium]|nr:GWxTD domain-containing protein [candidate division KSB1 bacterium]MCB9510245.1 GWxTD domain-containing protein [Deferribacteres bacterium]
MQIMKRIVLLILLFGLAGQASAQVEMANDRSLDLPLFFLDLVNTRSKNLDKSRLQVYVKIPYEELQFVKLESDSFRAKYEVTVLVLDEDDFQMDSRIMQRSITLGSYEETRERGVYDDLAAKFELEPNDYKVIVGLMDKETKQTTSQKTKMELRNFNDAEISISDVLIADSVDVDTDGSVLAHPHVNLPRDTGTRTLGYFEVYTKKKKGDLNVEITVRNSRNKKVYEDNRDFQIADASTPIVFEIADGELQHGRYKLKIKAKANGEKTELETVFTIFSRGMPLTSTDLESAIQQLRYIANGKDRDKIEDAPEDSQKVAFIEFWKKRDPTPGTEENEAMNEYYRRVAYANEHFGRFRDGWKTDMGMVYIVLGEPNDVERNPFNSVYSTSYNSSRTIKAFEVWHYYQYNRYFVFIDESGFGDFRLSNPVSLNDLMSLKNF